MTCSPLAFRRLSLTLDASGLDLTSLIRRLTCSGGGLGPLFISVSRRMTRIAIFQVSAVGIDRVRVRAESSFQCRYFDVRTLARAFQPAAPLVTTNSRRDILCH